MFIYIHRYICKHIHIYIYAYIKKGKLVTLVEGDQTDPFSISTTPSCKGRRYVFSWIAPFYPWYVCYIAVCQARRYQVPFLKSDTTWDWYDTTWDWTPVSWTIGELSSHQANELVKCIYICMNIYTYIYANAFTYVYIHVYIYVFIYIHMHIYKHTDIYVGIYIYIYIYIYIFIYIYIYVCVCVCVCVFVCT